MDYDMNEIIFEFWSKGTMVPKYRRVTLLTNKKLVIESGMLYPTLETEDVHEYDLKDDLFYGLWNLIRNEKRQIVDHESGETPMHSTDGVDNVFTLNINGELKTTTIYNALRDYPDDIVGEDREDVISYARLFSMIFEALEDENINIWKD